MPKELYLQSEGEFEVVVSKPQSGWLGKSKEKQTPYVLLVLTVEDEDASEEDNGKHIQWYGYLSDKAIERTIDTLVACFNFDGDLNGLYAGKQTLEGFRARITVEAEDYEGKRRYKVKWLNPSGYVHTPQTLPPEEGKLLVAGLSSKVKAAALDAKARLGRAEREPKNVTAKPVTVPEGEDDVPF